jgi:hypothetical protein
MLLPIMEKLMGALHSARRSQRLWVSFNAGQRGTKLSETLTFLLVRDEVEKWTGAHYQGLADVRQSV